MLNYQYNVKPGQKRGKLMYKPCSMDLSRLPGVVDRLTPPVANCLVEIQVHQSRSNDCMCVTENPTLEKETEEDIGTTLLFERAFSLVNNNTGWALTEP